MNTFTTVFFVHPPPDDFFGFLAFLPLMLGLVMLWGWVIEYRRDAKDHLKKRNFGNLLPAGILLLIGLFFTLDYVGSYIGSRSDAAHFAELYETQQYQVVEGTVHVLRVQPKGGHAPGDLIEIDNQQFDIDYYYDTVGYSQTIANGGALTEGTYARVYFVDETIIRVEVQLPAQLPSP